MATDNCRLGLGPSAAGRLRRACVECTGSCGAALTRYLHREGITVTEVDQPDKATRRRRGKTDAIDAAAAAQAVVSGRATATATAKAGDGPVEAIRMFKVAKTSATKSRSQAINQLRAVLVAADPAPREALNDLSNPKLIRKCSSSGNAPSRRPPMALPQQRRPATHSGSWPDASSISPRRSTTSPRGSPPPSPSAHRGCWTVTASARTPPSPR
ncbi:IS110 family transposase [Streptomyces macrosporus]|uniref:Transposase IS110-like N-terminal domain-containing protein n=1 Tax=Streptomyces macrosporus TaxID=44032 RepID=A0ABP5XIY9_9ACTN